ncbi:membrane-bound serine protease (ClpP class) [Caldicoprobacter guelmensis]|uniref:NfeD family protein n=1 Tax=Caldicoprobacter guelmensis TaxID=1170224 RepID=UPI001959E081|nr:NfeD family protein [Caldicoprobacter guelmensis]MBM7581825.1 membrane-bound serine protease (ClpP class) [Caldicoprobacter guelmensis]
MSKGNFINKKYGLGLVLGFMIVAVWAAGALALADNDRVYVVPIQGEITPAMAAFVEKQVRLANADNAGGILFVISTLGGRVDAAFNIKKALLESKVPTAVYIIDRAESAGALIAIASDTIIMAPGSHMGSAEPIPYTEKNVAAISGEFRSTAELKGRDPKIAAAMVDRTIEIPGIKEKGSLLDLTIQEALKCGYADAIAKNVDDALSHLGWADAQIYRVEPDFKIKIAQFLTRTDVSSLLLLVGMIAILIEVFVPGFGLPGIIGVICFGLYFGGNFLAGYTEWWSIMLFVIGLILLAIELAVPGFGVFGIGGIIAILGGLVFSASDFAKGMMAVGIALLAAIIAIPILYGLFGGPRLLRKLVLTEKVVTVKEAQPMQKAGHVQLVGKAGSVVTPLRPAGIVEIEGVKYDVVSDGEFILPGEKVKVVEVEGSKIVVTRL